MKVWEQHYETLQQGDIKVLARVISLVENEVEGFETFMESLPENGTAKIIGITGPPGAGKSTLTDALIELLILENKKVGVLCVDPSSPFNFGSLLGDRIRMSAWFNHPNVFIRSLATRGSLGGLNPKIIEITDVMKAAGYDYIIIETVGVGQSEVEIAGLADVTVVVLVPEGGDVIQTMKAGLMEIADIFVVNKSDRPDAETYINYLKMMLAPAFNKEETISIIKTIASEKKGIQELKEKIFEKNTVHPERKVRLLADKAFQLIQNKKMKNINKEELFKRIQSEEDFNLYRFVQKNA